MFAFALRGHIKNVHEVLGVVQQAIASRVAAASGHPSQHACEGVCSREHRTPTADGTLRVGP